MVELTPKTVGIKKDQQIFHLLKTTLPREEVMAHPKTEQEYLLYMDACYYARGTILCQPDGKGVGLEHRSGPSQLFH